MTVSKIVISSVSVSAGTAGKYNIFLSWTVDIGASDYTGDFWLVTHFKGGSNTPVKIDCKSAKVRSYTVLNITLDTTKTYSVELLANNQQAVGCAKVPITLKTFEGVGVHYENDIVTVGWNPPHSSITSGMIRLSFPDNYFDYGVPDGLHVYTFAIPEEWLDSHCYRMPLPSSWFSQETCTISMTPYADEISSGIKSNDVTLPLKPLEITKAELGATNKTTNERKITLNLSDSKATHVQLGFYENERLIHLTAPVVFAKPLNTDITGQIAHNAEKYELHVYISDQTAKSYNRRKSDGNTIPLISPVVETDVSSGRLVLSWAHNAPGCTEYT
jgi:hypothetical protein